MKFLLVIALSLTLLSCGSKDNNSSPTSVITPTSSANNPTQETTAIDTSKAETPPSPSDTGTGTGTAIVIPGESNPTTPTTATPPIEYEGNCSLIIYDTAMNLYKAQIDSNPYILSNSDINQSVISNKPYGAFQAVMTSDKGIYSYSLYNPITSLLIKASSSIDSAITLYNYKMNPKFFSICNHKQKTTFTAGKDYNMSCKITSSLNPTTPTSITFTSNTNQVGVQEIFNDGKYKISTATSDNGTVVIYFYESSAPTSFLSYAKYEIKAKNKSLKMLMGNIEELEIICNSI